MQRGEPIWSHNYWDGVGQLGKGGLFGDARLMDAPLGLVALWSNFCLRVTRAPSSGELHPPTSLAILPRINETYHAK